MSLDVKICGLRTEAALAAALANGASHVGFIFFPKSPRHVEPALAGRLRQAAFGRAAAVAVTVDADDLSLDAIVRDMAPDVLQLHGRETPARVAEVRQRYRLPVMKALAIAEPGDLARAQAYRTVADRLLFDARPPVDAALPGGNGVAFDWRILSKVDRGLDYVLSGGLDAGNVGKALALAEPTGIDVSSGVESAPGQKDPALIDAFFRAVRAAGKEVPRRAGPNV